MNSCNKELLKQLIENIANVELISPQIFNFYNRNIELDYQVSMFIIYLDFIYKLSA